MIRRTIEVSGFDAALSARNKQIIVSRDGYQVGQFPAEDVGLLIVDTRQASFTNETLVTVTDAGGMVVLCGSDHLPAAMVLPVQGHCLQGQRLATQLGISVPRKKRLWQQLVQGKLRNQAEACSDSNIREKLANLTGRVLSGDSGNSEAHGARIYWSCWLPKSAAFRRQREGPSPNHFLNYGYMILRAAVARAICGAGLNPAFGLHHCNRSNGFALADDLVEPLRPWVDLHARDLYLAGETDLVKSTKAKLAGVMYEEVWSAGQQTTMGTAIEWLVDSLVRCYEERDTNLSIPQPIGWKVYHDHDKKQRKKQCSQPPLLMDEPA